MPARLPRPPSLSSAGLGPMTFDGNTAEPEPNDWGRFRAPVEEQVAACADQLGRLRRALMGPVPADRHYVGEKARALMAGARRLVRLGQDVERRFGDCDARYETVSPATGTR